MAWPVDPKPPRETAATAVEVLWLVVEVPVDEEPDHQEWPDDEYQREPDEPDEPDDPRGAQAVRVGAAPGAPATGDPVPGAATPGG